MKVTTAYAYTKTRAPAPARRLRDRKREKGLVKSVIGMDLTFTHSGASAQHSTSPLPYTRDLTLDSIL
jgi:hypothetical protein